MFPQKNCECRGRRIPAEHPPTKKRKCRGSLFLRSIPAEISPPLHIQVFGGCDGSQTPLTPEYGSFLFHNHLPAVDYIDACRKSLDSAIHHISVEVIDLLLACADHCCHTIGIGDSIVKSAFLYFSAPGRSSESAIPDQNTKSRYIRVSANLRV